MMMHDVWRAQHLRANGRKMSSLVAFPELSPRHQPVRIGRTKPMTVQEALSRSRTRVRWAHGSLLGDFSAVPAMVFLFCCQEAHGVI